MGGGFTRLWSALVMVVMASITHAAVDDTLMNYMCDFSFETVTCNHRVKPVHSCYARQTSGSTRFCSFSKPCSFTSSLITKYTLDFMPFGTHL